MLRTTVVRTTLLVGAACLVIGWPASSAGPAGDGEDAGESAEEAARIRLLETYREGSRLSEAERWNPPLASGGWMTRYLAERSRRGREPATGAVPEPDAEIRRPFSRPAVPRRHDARIATCLAQGAGGDVPDVCRLGEAVSRMLPCLDRDDCPAYEAWRQLYGPPGVVPAAPAERPAPSLASRPAPGRED